jgi:hypothetical protein
MNAEQDIAAGIDLRHRSARFVSIDGTDDVERRANGAVVIGSPAHQAEHLARRIAFDALAAADNLVGNRLAELEPVLALALSPEQRDVSQLRLIAQPRFGWPARRRYAIRPQRRIR